MPTGIDSKKEPSRLMAYVYAILMSAIGLLFGVVYMLSFPSQSFSSMKEQAEAMEGRESLGPVPGDAFYIEGPILRTRSWEGKRERFLNGPAGALAISAGEINAWLSAKFRPVSGPPSADDEKGLLVLPGQPNVAVTENGVLYVNLPAEITGYGMDGEYVLSAIATYGSGAPAKFIVQSIKVDSAEVPLPGILGAQIVKALLEGYSESEEFQVIEEAWSRVDAVEVVGTGLKFSLL